jgi:hypothetical protein
LIVSFSLVFDLILCVVLSIIALEAIGYTRLYSLDV